MGLIAERTLQRRLGAAPLRGLLRVEDAVALSTSFATNRRQQYQRSREAMWWHAVSRLYPELAPFPP